MKNGSEIKVERMLQTFPLDIQRQIFATGSTRCHRDLTPAEIEYIGMEGNKGTAASLKKAGPRRLDAATKQKRDSDKAVYSLRKIRKGGNASPCYHGVDSTRINPK